ncbi:MAG: peptide ABC transporter substrate-binding protein [Oscillospiraceae bacterium]
MKKFRSVLALVLALTLCLSLTACGKKPGGDTAEGTRNEYNRLYGAEVTTLNYLVTGNTNDLKMSANNVDCLVEYDQYGVMIPSLAESWEHNDDYTVWTFHIRPDVKWMTADSEEYADVTANDWVSAASYVLDAANASATEYMYDGIVKNAADYYSYTAYLVESENGTLTVNADGDPIDVVDKVDFADVGVKAVDDLTLEYTMEQPTPYFPSVLSYASYMPVYGPFLEEKGAQFGVDNYSVLYNGAFIMSEFEPQNHRTLIKNEKYWDVENVFLDKMNWMFNTSDTTLAPESFLRGEVDWAEIGSSVLDAWMNDPEKKDLVCASRPDNSYSYFYAFNFEPRFDAAYEPANWNLAVNNENFRQSIRHGLDRLNAKMVDEPYNPQTLITNTVTPKNFAIGAGLDYTQYPAVKPYTDGDSFDEKLALEYKDKAVAELTALGATFPVKVLMPYNPSTSNWDKECQVVEQQLEKLLGADYIDIIVEAGPANGFLGEVRRGGKFALMKCNWGADYADPQTWTDPFNAGGTLKNSSYNFMYTVEDAVMAGTAATSKTADTQKIVSDYAALLKTAKGITNDEAARYTAFAEAEAQLLSHAMVIPYSVSSDGYVATRTNVFEAQYAPYGLALQRFKYQHVYENPMSMTEFDAAMKTWDTERAAAIAKAK